MNILRLLIITTTFSTQLFSCEPSIRRHEPQSRTYGTVEDGPAYKLTTNDGRTFAFKTNGYTYGALDLIQQAQQLAKQNLISASTVNDLIVAYCDTHTTVPNLGYESPYYANAQSQTKVEQQHIAVLALYQQAKRAKHYEHTRNR